MDYSKAGALEAHRAQAEKGHRAALALEFVGMVIDGEIATLRNIIEDINTVAKNETTIETAQLIRAFKHVKALLQQHKQVGEESAAKLREEN
jgi:hypothetical protein